LVLLKHRHQTEQAANSLKLDLLRLQHLADLEVIPSLSFIPLHEAQVLLDQEHSRQMEGIHLLEERLPTVKVLLVMVLMVCILRQDLHWLAQTETVIHSNSVQYRERLLLLVQVLNQQTDCTHLLEVQLLLEMALPAKMLLGCIHPQELQAQLDQEQNLRHYYEQ
jgi:hypothetical protein